MPASVAAAMSTLSTPMPKRETIRQRFICWIISAVIVAYVTRRASAAVAARTIASGGGPCAISNSAPIADSTSRAGARLGKTESETTTRWEDIMPVVVLGTWCLVLGPSLVPGPSSVPGPWSLVRSWFLVLGPVLGPGSRSRSWSPSPWPFLVLSSVRSWSLVLGSSVVHGPWSIMAVRAPGTEAEDGTKASGRTKDPGRSKAPGTDQEPSTKDQGPLSPSHRFFHVFHAREDDGAFRRHEHVLFQAAGLLEPRMAGECLDRKVHVLFDLGGILQRIGP